MGNDSKGEIMNMVTNKDNERTLIKIAEEAPLVIAADNEQWEALMASDEAQTLLNKMAGEALSEHQTGKTKTMGFNHGRIVPG